MDNENNNDLRLKNGDLEEIIQEHKRELKLLNDENERLRSVNKGLSDHISSVYPKTIEKEGLHYPDPDLFTELAKKENKKPKETREEKAFKIVCIHIHRISALDQNENALRFYDNTVNKVIESASSVIKYAINEAKKKEQFNLVIDQLTQSLENYLCSFDVTSFDRGNIPASRPRDIKIKPLLENLKDLFQRKNGRTDWVKMCTFLSGFSPEQKELIFANKAHILKSSETLSNYYYGK